MIGETGWPSAGRMRDGALPSRVNAATFLRGFTEMATRRGLAYNLIEAFDQPWKRALGHSIIQKARASYLVTALSEEQLSNADEQQFFGYVFVDFDQIGRA